MILSATRRAVSQRPHSRFPGAFLAAALMAVALAGCQVSEFAYDAPEMAPVPASLQSKMTRLDMDKRAPIMLRIYKEENALEVWKETRSGRYALLTEYDICAWSGKLGPKKKEGDRQAPEGFYAVTPAQMNPNSSYHLSFNIGFPNAYDRSLGRTGSHLMVHGDCSSRGCYAMEDAQIQEIYALAREAFRGGQQAFQIQAYPFRMTPENLARYSDNENFAFWEMLKEGSDHFEVTRRVPKVNVCGQRYVFNANATGGSFSPGSACPAYDVPDDIEQLVVAKSQADLEKQQKVIARASAREQREQRWAEREAAIATFFDRSRSGDEDAAPDTATAVGDAAASASVIATGSVPVPRRSPIANSGVAVAKSSGSGDGGFRLPNPFARFSSPQPEAAPVASTSGVDGKPAAAETAAAPPAAAEPEPTPQVAARQAVEPQTTVTEPLAYAPAADDESGGFFSNVAKTSRGIFKRAGSIFN